MRMSQTADMPPGTSGKARANPRVTFIVTSYNKATYLPTVLESVWLEAQDVDGDVLLVDDGSTDGSERLCARFAQSHPGISYTSQENAGIYRTLNRHAPLAQGEWVRFCDGDDPLVPGSTRQLVDAAACHGAMVAHGRPIDYGPEPLSQLPAATETGAHCASGCHADPFMFVIRSLNFTPSCSLYRRSALEKAFPLPEHLVSCQDYAMLLPVLAQGALAWVDAPVCCYLSGVANQLSANDALTRQQTMRITEHYRDLLAQRHRRAAMLKAAQRTRRWLRKARPEDNSFLAQLWLLGIVARVKLGFFNLQSDLDPLARIYEDDLRDILSGDARAY